MKRGTEGGGCAIQAGLNQRGEEGIPVKRGMTQESELPGQQNPCALWKMPAALDAVNVTTSYGEIARYKAILAFLVVRYVPLPSPALCPT